MDNIICKINGEIITVLTIAIETTPDTWALRNKFTHHDERYFSLANAPSFNPMTHELVRVQEGRTELELNLTTNPFDDSAFTKYEIELIEGAHCSNLGKYICYQLKLTPDSIFIANLKVVSR